MKEAAEALIGMSKREGYNSFYAAITFPHTLLTDSNRNVTEDRNARSPCHTNISESEYVMHGFLRIIQHTYISHEQAQDCTVQTGPVNA